MPSTSTFGKLIFNNEENIYDQNDNDLKIQEINDPLTLRET